MGTDSPVIQREQQTEIAGYRQRPDLSLRNTLDFTSIGVNPSSYQDGTQPIHQNLGPIMMVFKQQQKSKVQGQTFVIRPSCLTEKRSAVLMVTHQSGLDILNFGLDDSIANSRNKNF